MVRSVTRTTRRCRACRTSSSARTARRRRNGCNGCERVPARRQSSDRWPPPNAISAISAFPIACMARRSERTWPLSGLPLLIDEDEWAEISAGIVQRGVVVRGAARRCLRRRNLVADGVLPGGGGRRQQGISATDGRRPAARRTLDASLCRRYRPRSRRTLVGSERSRAGAVRRGLRAGKPARDVARLSARPTRR